MLIKTLAAACLSVACLCTPVASFAVTSVWVQVAPPPPRVERIPEPRRGYQWVPGYWDWQGNRHVWKQARWVRERQGYAYVQPRWVEDNGRWRKQQGQWSRRDRDGDGVPNGRDRDRDGDGVRNSNDRRPDDPTRR